MTMVNPISSSGFRILVLGSPSAMTPNPDIVDPANKVVDKLIAGIV